MGGNESIENERTYDLFIVLATDVRNTCGKQGENRWVDELKKTSALFYEKLERCISKGKMFVGQLDNTNTKLQNSFESLEKCARYLKSKSNNNLKISLRTDFINVCKQLHFFLDSCLGILESLISKTNPAIMYRFELELNIFNFVFNVQPLDEPPFYIFKILPIYSIRHQINKETSKYLCINTPHGTGKTLGAPLIIASRALSDSNSSQFLIIVANSSIDLYNLSKTLGDESLEPIEVTTNINTFCEVLEKNGKLFQPFIGIFNTFDTLKIIQKYKKSSNSSGFFSKTRFIIDNFHQRSIEADVMFEILSKETLKHNKKKMINEITLMSSTPDLRLKNYLSRHFRDFSVDDITVSYFDVQNKNVVCNDISEIAEKMVFIETNHVLSYWANKHDYEHVYPIGDILVFMSNDSIGYKFGKKIIKMYDFTTIKTKRPIFPLKLRIKSNEKIEDFFVRTVNEINITMTEREADIEGHEEPLFFLPIYLTSTISKKQRELANANLPLYLKNKLVRFVIITDLKNESTINVQNSISVVFDTGVNEVEYYDQNLGLSVLKEEMIPDCFCEQRMKLLGRNNNGLYVHFSLRNNLEPKKNELSLEIKRIDMRMPFLRLRKLGIRLEDQRNLPSEPNRGILSDCVMFYKKIGVLTNDHQNELTELGKKSIVFSDVSPVLAVATAKYTGNLFFAYLISLIIDYSDSLVDDMMSPIFYQNFCNESDLVTLFVCIVSIFDQIDEKSSESGFDASVVQIIYNTFENICNEIYPDRNVTNIIAEMSNWAKSQANGVLGCIDSFLQTINQVDPHYLNKKAYNFKHIIGAGNNLQPTLVFSPYLADSEIGNVNITNRPGWNGLQCPGNSYILSLKIRKKSNKIRTTGFLIHHNSNLKTNPGVRSKKTNNPSLNSYYYVSLFNAYWNDQPTMNDFVGIYHSRMPNKDFAYLIHVTESIVSGKKSGETFINYCPKTNNVNNMMNNALPIISSLMPFVPRSILIKNNAPLCAVEVMSYGSYQYSSSAQIIGDPDSSAPIPYNLNRNTLTFAFKNIQKLRKNNTLIRFAITGESVFYRLVNNKPIDIDLEYPDVRSSLKTVFGNFASHLVLLVDKNEHQPPGEVRLKWNDDNHNVVGDGSEGIDLNYISTITTKIINGIGYAAAESNFFFVNLNNGKIVLKKGQIPEKVKARVGCKDGRTMDENIYHIVKSFNKIFISKQKLIEPIPLIEISSNSSCRAYNSDQAKANICAQICIQVAKNFNVPNKDDVQAIFMGNSLIGIRISWPINKDLVKHIQSRDIYDDSYRKCQADTILQNTMNALRIPSTNITHFSCMKLRIQHTVNQRLSIDKFKAEFEKCANKFGFLQSMISEYIDSIDGDDDDVIGDGRNRRILGYMEVELIDPICGVALAYELHEAIQADATFVPDFFTTMMATRTMMTTMTSRLTLNPKLGPVPKIKMNDRLFSVPKDEIDTMKELLNLRAREKTDAKRWTFDDRYRILIVPEMDAEDAKKLMLKIAKEEHPIYCPLFCDPETQVVVPQQFYAYNQDGSVVQWAICEECMKSEFLSRAYITNAINPNSLIVNFDEIKKVNEDIMGIPCCDCDNVGADEKWPQVPLGQLIWTLMSEKEIFGHFIRVWFNIVADKTIRFSRHLFTTCPNHPDIYLLLPKGRTNLRCPHCDCFHCCDCHNWHRKDDKCPVEDNTFKRCPRCRAPTLKTEGCDHISCRCGCHWCYKCAKVGFNIADECYTHMGTCRG